MGEHDSPQLTLFCKSKQISSNFTFIFALGFSSIPANSSDRCRTVSIYFSMNCQSYIVQNIFLICHSRNLNFHFLTINISSFLVPIFLQKVIYCSFLIRTTSVNSSLFIINEEITLYSTAQKCSPIYIANLYNYIALYNMCL